MYKKILYTLYIMFILLSCNDVKIDNYSVDYYSIYLAEFNSLTKAYNYKYRLNYNLQDSITIKNLSNNRYIILYGRYNSSFAAGERAFNLFMNSLINNYKIFHNNEFINDLFANVLFIANYLGRPSIYNFNLVSKQITLLWSRWGRKVLSLIYSKDKNAAFFLTAQSYKMQSAFPFIKDIKLFHYDALKKGVNEIYSFGDGIQIYSYWDIDDTLKVNITNPDSMKPEILVQKIYSFNYSGELLNIKQRSFQLINDGFPKPPKLKPNVVSPKGRFQIRNVKENKKKYIYLRDVIKNSQILLAEYEGNLKNITWTDDEKYCMIIISNFSAKNMSKLLIINNEKMNIENNFYGPLTQNLLVHGNFLFFEEQNNGLKQIAIYEFKKKSIYHRIKFDDGCGLNNL